MKYKTHHLHLIDLKTIVTIFKLDKLGNFSDEAIKTRHSSPWRHISVTLCLLFFPHFPLSLALFFPLNPSHLRFHTRPNYRIRQANWGCLKQVSLVSSGNYGSCCKQPFGHRETLSVFRYTHKAGTWRFKAQSLCYQLMSSQLKTVR